MLGSAPGWSLAAAGLLVGAPTAQPTPQLTRPPLAIEVLSPAYPDEALARGSAGAVELWVDLDALGAVTEVRVLSAPDDSLAAAASKAMRASRFSPAEIDGKPAPIRFVYVYHFTLPAPPVESSPAPSVPTQTTPSDSAALETPIKAPPALPNSTYESVVRTKAPVQEVSLHRVERQDFASVPGVFGDPLRVVETMPGVGRSPFASGILVMRGSSPDDSSVFVDGHRIPLLYHFGGGPSVIPPEAIEAIDIQTGAFGPRYGRATGGIVDVETRPGRTDRYHGSADIDLLDVGGSIEGPLTDHGSFRASARRSYIDALIPLVRDTTGQGQSLTLAPRYYDYHTRADLAARSGLELSLLAYGADDRLTFADQRGIADLPEQLDLRIVSHRLNPLLRADLGHGFALSVSPAIGWLMTRGDTPFSFLDLQTLETDARVELSAQSASGGRVLVGTEVTREHHGFTARLPNLPTAREFPSPDPDVPLTSDVIGKFTVNQVGVYGQGEIHIGRLHALPGLRLNHATYAGEARAAFDPRLTMRVQLHDGLAAKLGAGVYHRLPEPHELAPATGNPDLELEESLQLTSGVEWSPCDVCSIEVQGFAKSMDHLAQATSKVRWNGNQVEPVRYRSNGQGRALGAEIMVQRRMKSGFSGWLAYSISRSERRDRGGDWSLYVRDQTHNVTGVMAYDLTQALRLATRVRYVTGYPVAQVTAADYDTDTARFVPHTDRQDPERLPAFFQWDVRAEKLFGDREANYVLAYADVQNLTNRQNAEFFQYSHDYSQRYAYPGLPIFPSVGVEAHF